MTRTWKAISSRIGAVGLLIVGLGTGSAAQQGPVDPPPIFDDDDDEHLPPLFQVPRVVFARGVGTADSGDLVIFEGAGPRAGFWTAAVVTDPACQFQGNPVPFYTWTRVGDRRDVVARNSSGHLIHFWWNPPTAANPGWQCQDVTNSLANAPLFGTDAGNASYPAGTATIALTFATRLDVVGHDSQNRLFHYWFTPLNGWAFERLDAMEHPAIVGQPDVMTLWDGVDMHLSVFARALDAPELVHYSWVDRANLWTISKLTQDLSGTLAAPAFIGDPVAVKSRRHDGRHRVDVFSTDANFNLSHYWTTDVLAGTWTAVDRTANSTPVGLTSSPTTNGRLSVAVTEAGGYVGIDLVARTPVASGLEGVAHYWWSEDPEALQDIWYADELQNGNVSNPAIVTDPLIAVTREEPSPGQPRVRRYHVFGENAAPNAGNLVAYEGDSRSIGWTGQDLTSMFAPPHNYSLLADSLDADDGQHGSGAVQTFARNATGQLVSYWINDRFAWIAINLHIGFPRPLIAGDPIVLEGRRARGQ
jgi:hypothetical protein